MAESRVRKLSENDLVKMIGGLICIYNVDKKTNYQLISGASICAFQSWKRP